MSKLRSGSGMPPSGGCESAFASAPNAGNDVDDADYRFDALESPNAMHSFAQLRFFAQPGRAPSNRSLTFRCGPGRVSHVTSNCAVWRDRGTQVDGMSRTFSVLAHVDGGPSYIGQSGRRCRMVPGDLCLVDGDLPFQIEPAGAAYTHLVLSLPREPVLQRFPNLRSSTAQLLDTRDPGNLMYQRTMLGALTHIASLDDSQRRATLDALAHLLGALKPPPHADPSDPTIETALRLIEDHLHDTRLGAEWVARRIGLSRRRLDERFVRACGMPVAAHIAERRMVEAARALSEPEPDGRTVWSIAASLGFTDAAHFARAFKRRYGVTASAFRQANGLSQARSPRALPH